MRFKKLRMNTQGHIQEGNQADYGFNAWLKFFDTNIILKDTGGQRW